MTILLLLTAMSSGAGAAATPSPAPSASPSIVGPTATATRSVPATATLGVASATPTPRVLSGGRVSGGAAAGSVEPDAAVAAPAAPVPMVPAPGQLAPAAPVPPRVYRTPARTGGGSGFAAPGSGADAPEAERRGSAVGDTPVMPARPAARGGSASVVFRVSARTAVEGFDLRIGYPRSAGSFGDSTHPAECNAGTGMLIAANDRGTGDMRLIVASAQALPFPIDVFCRFGTEPGAGVGAADFSVRVAEVTSDGKRADPGLLLVSVVVR